ncbi:hypothetical protein BDV18DRAFT_137901 [Aspergillus unguis]
MTEINQETLENERNVFQRLESHQDNYLLWDIPVWSRIGLCSGWSSRFSIPGGYCTRLLRGRSTSTTFQRGQPGYEVAGEGVVSEC